MPATIRYHFSQAFKIPAEKAYLYCTDFSPDDPKIMALDNARREVTELSDGTVILKETIQTASHVTEKLKLVHLYPHRLMWVSTHLSGPNKHSQFIYEITAKGRNASQLDFTAFHIEHRSLSEKDVHLLEEKLCRYDMEVWSRLAGALEEELLEGN